MGVEIVKAATVYGKRLSGNAYKALIAMSLSALDKPHNGRPSSLYWGGWDALALALGHENADRNSAGHNAVARAVRELRQADHITPMVDAGRGTRQSYMVHPGGLKGPVDNAVQGEQNAHPMSEQSAHAKGEQNAHQRVSKTVPPRKEQGSTGLNQDRPPTAATSTTDRATTTSSTAGVGDELSQHAHQGDRDDNCAVCGLTSLNLIHARARMQRRA